MISYRPLKRMLVEKGYSMRRMIEEAGISNEVATRFSKNQSVTLAVINKVCTFFKCQPSNVIVYLEDDDADI